MSNKEKIWYAIDLPVLSDDKTMLGTDTLYFSFSFDELNVYDLRTLTKIAELLGVDYKTTKYQDRLKIIGKIKRSMTYNHPKLSPYYKATEKCGLILERSFSITGDGKCDLCLTLYNFGCKIYTQEYVDGILLYEIIFSEGLEIQRHYSYQVSRRLLQEIHIFHDDKITFDKRIEDQPFCTYQIGFKHVTQEEYQTRLNRQFLKLYQVAELAKSYITSENIPLNKIIAEYLFPH